MDDPIFTMPVEGLLRYYEDMYTELEPVLQRLEAVKNEISRRVKDRAETVQHGRVTATYRNGYDRETWDGKGLSGYAVAHPEVMTFCKKSTVGPSVSIAVK